jgi:PilZ domain
MEQTATEITSDPGFSDETPGSRVLFGRFMLPDTSEHPCQVTGLTVDGAIFTTEQPPPVGLPIVAYIDTIGRVVGVSADRVEGGFKVKFPVAGNRRDRLALRLRSLDQKPDTDMGDAEQPRRAVRFKIAEKSSHLGLPDGRVYACEVIDISLTGAAVKTDVMPTLGTCVMLGKMRGRIVRYTEQGIAIEFVSPMDHTALAKHIR